MARENWQISSDSDPKGRERFCILYVCEWWEKAALVARFNNHVTRAVAEEVRDLLIERIGQTLDANAEEARRWMERNAERHAEQQMDKFENRYGSTRAPHGFKRR